MRSWRFAAALFALGLFTACDARETPSALYDASTRRLVRLDSDTDADGIVDTRTYANGSRIFRSEIDTNGDGRIDRWEYLSPTSALQMVGSAANQAGREELWTYPEVNGEIRVDRVIGAHRHATRREFYRGGTLMRSEEDTNDDGLVDKWELYEAGRLRVMAFDTTRATSRPDRRLVYDQDARFSHLEIDPDGDGQFERVIR